MLHYNMDVTDSRKNEETDTDSDVLYSLRLIFHPRTLNLDREPSSSMNVLNHESCSIETLPAGQTAHFYQCWSNVNVCFEDKFDSVESREITTTRHLCHKDHEIDHLDISSFMANQLFCVSRRLLLHLLHF